MAGGNPVINPLKFLGIKLIYWIMLISFGLHVIVAALPGNLTISDEPYYVSSAINMLHGAATNFEHPPLAKIFIATFIAALGNNWIAWRLPTILFALLATWLTYKISRKFLSENASAYTTAILSLSTIFLFIGSTAMLDIPCVALGLTGLYLALQKRYGWSGLAFALSFLCKELAILMFTATLLYLIKQKIGKWRIIFFSTVAFTTSFVGLWIYDLTYGSAIGTILSNPASTLYYMIMHYLKLIRTHAYYPPISWVTPFGNNAWNPMQLFSWQIHGKLFASWVIQPNAAVEYLTFPLLIALPILYWKHKQTLALLSWLWIATTYLPWLTIGFFVKPEVNYYITYSVPFLAIGSTYLWTTTKNRKLKYALATTQLTLGITWFIYYLTIYPFTTK